MHTESHKGSTGGMDLCAAVCERCAKSCEAVGSDEIMKSCADLCRKCAASCGRMSGSN